MSTLRSCTSRKVGRAALRLLWSVFLLNVDICVAAEITLEAVLNGDHRQQSSTRDRYRHPEQTLNFFELQPSQTVVEIWPGGAGWYSEILAPFLRDHGKFYAAQFNADSTSAFYRRSRQQFVDKMESQPALYSQVMVTSFNPPDDTEIAPPGSADRVLTFRNVHNWYIGGGEQRVVEAFKAFYRALKPGGLLGVVEHRLPEERPANEMVSSGYMQQSFVVYAAEKAGFKLVASAEINANPADNARHPEGVWSLPPTLREGNNNQTAYLAIGESDRMTLKFIKPSVAKSSN